MSKTTKDKVTVYLKLDTELYNRIKKSAEVDRRSMPMQIAFFCEQGLSNLPIIEDALNYLRRGFIKPLDKEVRLVKPEEAIEEESGDAMCVAEEQ
jgi:hypothetical protein